MRWALKGVAYGLAFACLLGLYQLIAFHAGLPWPTEIINSNTGVGQFPDQMAGGIKRITSTFWEPSLLGYNFVGCLGLFLLGGRAPALGVLALCVLMLSTSSLGYFGLVALVGVWLVLDKRVSGSAKVRIGAAVAFTCLAFIGIDYLLLDSQALNDLVLNKADSTSGVGRSTADALALQTFIESGGTGCWSWQHARLELPCNAARHHGIAGRARVLRIRRHARARLLSQRRCRVAPAVLRPHRVSHRLVHRHSRSGAGHVLAGRGRGVGSPASPGATPCRRTSGSTAVSRAMSPADDRDASIDVARGIAIVLVVLGHNRALSLAWPALVAAIFLFHVPLFFLLSGRVLRPEQPLRAVPRLARRLLAPFLLAAMLVGAVKCVTRGESVERNVVRHRLGHGRDTAVVAFVVPAGAVPRAARDARVGARRERERGGLGGGGIARRRGRGGAAGGGLPLACPGASICCRCA